MRRRIRREDEQMGEGEILRGVGTMAGQENYDLRGEW